MMAEGVEGAGRTLREMLVALRPRDLKKALKSGYRREATEAKKIIARHVAGSGLGHASQVSKGLRTYIYPNGGGFLVSTVPRGKKGYHRNSRGKEKPVLMWAAEGTKERVSRKRFKNGRRRKSGAMPGYGYVEKAEPEVLSHVEKNLGSELERACDKAVRKLGL